MSILSREQSLLGRENSPSIILRTTVTVKCTKDPAVNLRCQGNWEPPLINYTTCLVLIITPDIYCFQNFMLFTDVDLGTYNVEVGQTLIVCKQATCRGLTYDKGKDESSLTTYWDNIIYLGASRCAMNKLWMASDSKLCYFNSLGMGIFCIQNWLLY